jgi:anti-anti-sigma regulatory factor
MAKFLTDLMVRAIGQVVGREIAIEVPAEVRILSEPTAELVVSVRVVGRFAVVRLARPAAAVESEVADSLRTHLSKLVDEGQFRQILDMGGVECASAKLVTCLVAHHCRLRKREGTFRLHGVGARVAAALGHCGLFSVLELYDNEQDALGGGNRLTWRV